MKVNSNGPIVVEIIFATISILCGLMMLMLIQKSRQNGFIMILRGLTVASIIYCSGFYFTMYDDDDGGGGPFLYLTVFGDILMAGWTFILSVNLFRMVFFLQSPNMAVEIIYYRIANFSVSLCFMVALGVTQGGHARKTNSSYYAFYWFRLSIIVINLSLYSICAIGLYRLPVRVHRQEVSQHQADGIAFVVNRLRYYCLAQVIVRIGALWFEYNENTMRDSHAHYFDAFLGPSSGFWYFVIFLSMQPDGLPLFKKTFLYWLPPKLYDRIQWPSWFKKQEQSPTSENSPKNDGFDRDSDYVADIVTILPKQDTPHRPASARITEIGIDLMVFSSGASKTSSHLPGQNEIPKSGPVSEPDTEFANSDDSDIEADQSTAT
jgi:hypothetical protein